MIPISDPDLRTRTTPYVRNAFIASNVLVALYQLTLGDLDGFIFTYRFGAIPVELLGGGELGVEPVVVGRTTQAIDLTSPVPTWATMFTSMFVHGGLVHLGPNMVFLWVFGDNVEDRFGHLRFLVFYLFAGVVAVWAQVLVSQGSDVPMVGASGAIAGVLGAYLLLFPFSRVTTLVFMWFVTTVKVPAIALIGIWAGLQLFSGLGSLGPSTAGTGVAYFAHLGGFAAGLAVTAAYHMRRREPIIARRDGRDWRGRPMDDR